MLIKYFYNNINEKKIFDYKNHFNLGLSMLSLYTLFYLEYLDFTCKVILFHAIIELFITKLDIFLHHLCVINLIYYKLYYEKNNNSDLITISLIKTELSTIFLVFHFYFIKIKKNNIIEKINMINDYLFVSSFFILRVYLYFTNIIMNKYTYVNLYSDYNYSLINHMPLYLSIYGLYILNLYWFYLIINKIIK